VCFKISELVLMANEFVSWHSVSEVASGVWHADSLRGRFARGAVWSFIGALTSQSSSLAASVITARVLGREQFGEYGMIGSTVGMFGIFAGMGLGLTATKYVAELRVTNRERTGSVIALSNSIAFGTAASVVIALLGMASWLATSTLNAPHLTTELRIGAGLLFLNALNGTQVGILAGFEAFRAIARVNLVRGLVTFPLAITGVLLWNLRGAVAALVAAAAVGWILNHIAIRAECRQSGVQVRWSRSWSDRRILWNFSLPAFLSSAMTSPAMWVATAILVNQPQGYAQMGVFAAANQWRAAVAFLPSLLSQPLLSMLANVGIGDGRVFRKLLHANVLLSLALSVLIAIPLISCSSLIMRAYGSSFIAGRTTLVLLIFATVISSTAAVIGQAIASIDRMWWGFRLNLVWAVVIITSALLLVPRYGAVGLAAAFLCAYLVHAVTLACFIVFQPTIRYIQTPNP
jgi:O-antigen/teichoic acid export membrane protein